jgi:hypothetical protein
MNEQVYALTIHDGKLIAGGAFTTAGGKVSAYLARWTKPDRCCFGRVGDADGSGDDAPTIGDVSLLIDALFVSIDLGLIECLSEADVDQSGGLDPQPSDITISDVTLLIDALFIRVDLSLLPDCL